ncbi:MAG: hypothetical protein IKF38_03155 [Clostridia bacterium]|nr:hypothetical protein [Clostridia bacterium]
MSKYLCVGIAKKIIAEVDNKEMAEEIEEEFFEKVDKNLYDVEFSSTENSRKVDVIFKLKDDMLAEHAMDLMIEQNQKYIKYKYSDEAIKYYQNIKSKSKEEILNLIDTENNPYLYTFRLGWYGFDIGYIFKKHVHAYIMEFVTFHTSEKTFMEEYYEFFNYVRNLLINSTDNPLRTALAVSL